MKLPRRTLEDKIGFFIFIFLILTIVSFLLPLFLSPFPFFKEYLEAALSKLDSFTAKFKLFLEGFPKWFSSLAFIFLYVLSNFVFFLDVKDFLKPVAALIFGAYFSTLLIYIAEVINAWIFFHLSRRYGQERLQYYLRGRFAHIYKKLEHIGIGWIFLLRLLPLVPYRILDISFGLTGVSFKKYLLVVLVASLPRIFWIQAVLAAVGSLYPEKIFAFFMANPHIFFFIFLYFIFSFILILVFRKRFK